MSEILAEEFDIYSVPGMDEAVLELQEKYGVEPGEAEQDIQLAGAMHNLLDYENAKRNYTAALLKKN